MERRKPMTGTHLTEATHLIRIVHALNVTNHLILVSIYWDQLLIVPSSSV